MRQVDIQKSFYAQVSFLRPRKMKIDILRNMKLSMS